MDREDIYRRLVATAEQYGAGNLQQLKLLRSQLQNCHPDEVLAGVLLVFSRSVLTEGNYQKQELAGRVLAKLNPTASFDVSQALREVLPAYNASIEQVPEYFAGRFGKEAVIKEVSRRRTRLDGCRSAMGRRCNPAVWQELVYPAGRLQR